MAAVTYRWSSLPEQRGWMLAHAGGRPIAEVCADFEREFGTPINRHQVSLFRQEYGLTSRRRDRKATVHAAVPVGTERDMKGYTMVKVREFASRPGTKDNWQIKQRWVWEQANGRELRRDELVLFADGDRGNFDPGNLVAIDRADIGVLNELGIGYRDRESLEAALAVVRLRRGVADALNGERTCGVCGRTFRPDNRSSDGRQQQRTCRACLDAGLRSKKDYGEGVCPRCGKTFKRNNASHLYCTPRCCYEDYRERKGK